MRRLKILFVFTALLSQVVLSHSVSAYTYGQTRYFSFARNGTTSSSSMSVYFNPTDGTYRRYATDTQGAATWIWSGSANVPSNGTITSITLRLANPAQETEIPEGSLFTFSVRYGGLAGSRVIYNGFRPGDNWHLLSDSCAQSASAEPGSLGETYAGDFTCTYYGVVGNNGPLSIITMSGYILNFQTDGLLVLANGGSFVEIEGEGGGSGSNDDIIDEIQYVLGEVRNNNAQNTVINNNITAIRDALAGSATTEGISTKLDTLIDSTEAQTAELERQYEETIQREEDKQNELEAQADDLSLSTPATANPFASLFTSADCANLPTIAGWLGTTPDKIRVCSPYPSQIRPVIEFLSSAIVVGLLIRLYYSKLQGGYAS